NLPASFLDDKVPELAPSQNVQAADPIATFQKINTEVRAANEKRIREIAADTAPERLWQGAFQQWANSQVTSRFAERRPYFAGAPPVPSATHCGYHLAPPSGAPVPAANSGRVLYAGDLGIYGNCVIIDHGMGVATLYGHLSGFAVKAGDRVAKGAVLG